jgi:hypothetical protein
LSDVRRHGLGIGGVAAECPSCGGSGCKEGHAGDENYNVKLISPPPGLDDVSGPAMVMRVLRECGTAMTEGEICDALGTQSTVGALLYVLETLDSMKQMGTVERIGKYRWRIQADIGSRPGSPT